MVEILEMQVQFADKSIEKSIVEISRPSEWKLSFFQEKIGKIENYASNLFDAQFSLRRQLEEQKCFLLCNGSRKNLVVSNMSKQMGGGRLGYIVQLGSQAKEDDMVDIFNFAEPDSVNTTEEQKEFYKIWFLSLRKKNI